MTRLARIRPSNLVIFAVLPFIIYLFIAVPNYRRSIIAIVGVALLALVTIGIIFARLYKRSTKETAFVRTGLGGQGLDVQAERFQVWLEGHRPPGAQRCSGELPLRELTCAPGFMPP